MPAVEIVYEHDPMALLRKLPFVGRARRVRDAAQEARRGAQRPRLRRAARGRARHRQDAPDGGVLRPRVVGRDRDPRQLLRGRRRRAVRAVGRRRCVRCIEQTPDADLRDDARPGRAGHRRDAARRSGDALPDLEEAPKLDPESERARLFESIAALLRNAAEQKPLVIFLDDLHWCDRPSLALLEQVARGIADQRIVIVGTYRDVEVDRVHPLAQTLAALRRMEHHERIAHPRLHARTSVYDLLTAIEPSEQAEPAKRGARAGAVHASPRATRSSSARC